MVQRSSTVLWRELDGEAVLLDPAAGCSYNLNAVGTLVWKMLDGTHSSQDIATAVCQAYEVTYEQALQDINAVLADFHENKLLTNSSASNTSPQSEI